MKKILMIIALAFVVFSCEKEEEVTPDNFMNGTSWEAPDDISTLLYGTSISVLEFLDNENFQEIMITRGSIRKTVQGTFTISSSLVTMTYQADADGDSREMQGTVSGSVMTTNMGTIAGGKRIYQKK